MILPEHQNNASLGSKFARALSNPVCLCLLLVAVTLVVYWPVTHYDFINYDDPDYFSANTHVQAGLTPGNVVWAFCTECAGNWHPLTWLFLMLDVNLFGRGPAGPHVTNLLFHLANTMLVFLLLRSLTRATWRSACVAALFALHPLHVESVAWISERKDVLSTFFGLLSLIAYTRYATGDKWRVTRADPASSPVTRHPSLHYFFALVFFALGLMSKPMLVTLPLAMLLLDWWPLERFKVQGSRFKVQSLVWEKIPFFVLSAISCVVTFIAQQKGGAVVKLARIPMTGRIANAFVSYARYLDKTLWPASLANPYPHPGHWGFPLVIYSVALVAGLSAIAVLFVRRIPFFFTGWFWFVGTLIPVIGLVQVGVQSMADRYTYVPLIGVFIILAWGLGAMCSNWHLPGKIPAVVVGIILVACALQTRNQTGYWQNGETLFRHTLAVTESNYMAHYNLGNTLLQSGQIDNAIAQYQKALEIRLGFADAHFKLGVALAQKGQVDEAMVHYQKTLEIQPDHADVLYNLGVILAEKGLTDEAIAHFRKALEIRPDFPNADNNLGVALAKKGLVDEAIAHWRMTIKVDPQYVNAWNNLAWVLATNPTASVRNGAEAVGLALRANQLSGGGNPAILRTLAAAYAESGRFTEAAETGRRALQLAATQTNTVLINALRVQIKLYEAGLPFRDID
jgi:tetratricopeptide (TPR) repeat protein